MKFTLVLSSIFAIWQGKSGHKLWISSEQKESFRWNEKIFSIFKGFHSSKIVTDTGVGLWHCGSEKSLNKIIDIEFGNAIFKDCLH